MGEAYSPGGSPGTADGGSGPLSSHLPADSTLQPCGPRQGPPQLSGSSESTRCTCSHSRHLAQTPEVTGSPESLMPQQLPRERQCTQVHGVLASRLDRPLPPRRLCGKTAVSRPGLPQADVLLAVLSPTRDHVRHGVRGGGLGDFRDPGRPRGIGDLQN